VGARGAPRRAQRGPLVDALGAELTRWLEEGAPEKLCVVLDHLYTPAELGWDALKGADRERANASRQLGEWFDSRVFLALLHRTESWAAVSAAHDG